MPVCRRLPVFLAIACIVWRAAAASGMDAVLILAQQGGTVRTQGGGKNYVLESVVVVLMLGFALFMVCRSSRRG